MLKREADPSPLNGPMTMVQDHELIISYFSLIFYDIYSDREEVQLSYYPLW